MQNRNKIIALAVGVVLLVGVTTFYLSSSSDDLTGRVRETRVQPNTDRGFQASQPRNEEKKKEQVEEETEQDSARQEQDLPSTEEETPIEEPQEEVNSDFVISTIAYNDVTGELHFTLANSGNEGMNNIDISSEEMALSIKQNGVFLNSYFDISENSMAPFEWAPAGGSETFTLSDVSLAPGDNLFEVCADVDFQEDESDEDNNCSSTVVTASTVTIGVYPSYNPVLDDVAVAGSNVLVARYRIGVGGTGVDFTVDKMTFENDPGNNSNNAVAHVTLLYPTDFNNPTNLDGSSTVAPVGGRASFTGLNIAVPASVAYGNEVNVEVWAQTNNLLLGTNTGDLIELDFLHDETFRAVNMTNGSTVTENSSAFVTTADVDSNEIGLYKSLPTFAKDTSSTAPCPTANLIASGASDVYCFKVTADPAGPVGLHKLTFDAVPVYLDAGLLSAPDAWTLHEYATNFVPGEVMAQGSWNRATNQATLTFNLEEVVNAGGTNYFVVRAPISFNANRPDSSALSVRLTNEVTTAHAASASAATVSGKNVWSDRSSPSHSLTTADWVNSYKLEQLPTAYLQLLE